MLETIRSIRLLDIVDILIVSYLIYRILLLIRGTRAVQMVTGIAVILLLYFVSAWFELQTLRVLLKTFLGSLLVVLVILFQAEFRRGLARSLLVCGQGACRVYEHLIIDGPARRQGKRKRAPQKEYRPRADNHRARPIPTAAPRRTEVKSRRPPGIPALKISSSNSCSSLTARSTTARSTPTAAPEAAAANKPK